MYAHPSAPSVYRYPYVVDCNSLIYRTHACVNLPWTLIADCGNELGWGVPMHGHNAQIHFALMRESLSRFFSLLIILACQVLSPHMCIPLRCHHSLFIHSHIIRLHSIRMVSITRYVRCRGFSFATCLTLQSHKSSTFFQIRISTNLWLYLQSLVSYSGFSSPLLLMSRTKTSAGNSQNVRAIPLSHILSSDLTFHIASANPQPGFPLNDTTITQEYRPPDGTDSAILNVLVLTFHQISS